MAAIARIEKNASSKNLRMRFTSVGIVKVEDNKEEGNSHSMQSIPADARVI
jgi:hypothetical protein